MSHLDISCVEDVLWVAARPTGLAIYDFDFRRYFSCRSSMACPPGRRAVARVGAISDYRQFYEEIEGFGLRLIHTPDEHDRASRLPDWYPRLADLTPRSVWYEGIPSIRQIEADFGWPIFVKGARQTHGHRRSLSIASDPEEYEGLAARYAADPVLRWQSLVVREFVPLRRVEETEFDRVPASFEFRTFWWYGRLVGAGRYWWEDRPYAWTEHERKDALEVAGEAAARLRLPFVAIDVALTEEGRWIVLECNDGQESGYAGVLPVGLWQSILTLESQHPRPSETVSDS